MPKIVPVKEAVERTFRTAVVMTRSLALNFVEETEEDELEEDWETDDELEEEDWTDEEDDDTTAEEELEETVEEELEEEPLAVTMTYPIPLT